MLTAGVLAGFSCSPIIKDASCHGGVDEASQEASDIYSLVLHDR